MRMTMAYLNKKPMNLNIRIIEKIIYKIENIKYEFNILDFLHKK